MRKQFFVGLCTMGLLLGSVTEGSAGQFDWTILTHSSVTGKGPGTDWLVGQGADPSNKCNFSPIVSCATLGSPTTGSFSYFFVDSVMASSCLSGQRRGQSCSTSSDCLGAPCVPCNPESFSFLGNLSDLSERGKGEFTVCQENGTQFVVKSMAIGASEAIRGKGGSCIVLSPTADDKSGTCGVGAFTSTIDLGLWVGSGGGDACTTYAGDIPNIGLDGRVYQRGSYPSSVNCGFATISTAYVSNLFGMAPSEATYLYVACEQQTFQTLQTACLSTAPFKAVVIAYTTADATTFDCSARCGTGGCLLGTAEEAE